MNDFASIEKRIQRLTAEELDMDVMEQLTELKSLMCTMAHMLMTQSNLLYGLQAQQNIMLYGSPHEPEDITKTFPQENDYNAVREYVERRKASDKIFRDYCLTHTRKQLCERLTDEFGWVVNPKNYGRNELRHPS